MMAVKITCDSCGAEITDEEYITLGSEGGKGLLYKKSPSISGLISLEKHHDLHFCSKQHFIRFFFGVE